MTQLELTVGTRTYMIPCAPGQENHLRKLASDFDNRVEKLMHAFGDVEDAQLFLAAGLILMDEKQKMDNQVSPLKPDPSTDVNQVEALAMNMLDHASKRLEILAKRITSLK